MQHEAMAVYGAILKRQKGASEASAPKPTAAPPEGGKAGDTTPPPEEGKADAPPDHDSKGKPKPKVDKAAKDAQKRG